MYSTAKNITYLKPQTDENGVCGKYLLYPDKTGKRKTEGGLRLINKYKQSLPNKPLVTIVTTVLNRALFIEKAMCSVFTQTYDNIEYIIVDAASKDNTLEKIKKYEDCVDYFVSEPDDGLYEGMNKGLSLANGDYILILNSDDWYTIDCVEVLVETILNRKIELVSALAIETDEYGDVIRRIPSIPFRDNIRTRMPLRHETMLISKKLYNDIGYYDPSYKIISDFKLTIKIYDKIKSFCEVNKHLMFFRKIGIASSLTPQLVEERKRLLSEQFPFLNKKELNLLANEYSKDISDYINLLEKYKKHEKFVKGIKGFLTLNGALKLLQNHQQ